LGELFDALKHFGTGVIFEEELFGHFVKPLCGLIRFVLSTWHSVRRTECGGPALARELVPTLRQAGSLPHD
jgi:hypothetical protein